MLEITDLTLFSLTEPIVLRALTEMNQYYAFNVDSGDQYELNNTSYRILQLIGQGVPFNELVQAFSKEFELQENSAKNDIKETIIFAIENKIVIGRNA